MFVSPKSLSTSTAPSIADKTDKAVLRKREDSRQALPIYYMVGNHDLGLPFVVGQKSSDMSSIRSKEQFIAKYGIPVDSHGFAVSEVSQAQRLSLNARLLISAGQASGTTHELVIVNAQDLVGMERDGGGPYDTYTRPDHKGHLDGPLLDQARANFKEAFQFVEAIGNDTSVDHIPRVLFIHVPLYRPQDSLCDHSQRSTAHGVYRESPRSLHQGTDQYSIYQNPLAEEVSSWLLEKVDPAVVFSGDDHDHCQVTHPRIVAVPPTSNVDGFKADKVPELTSKSTSMTEGVRQPGFARLSLSPTGGGVTMAYTPCLSPDQIGIWTQSYIPAFVLSVVFLCVANRWSGHNNTNSILPTANAKHKRRDSAEWSQRSEARRGSGVRDIAAVCVVAVPF